MSGGVDSSVAAGLLKEQGYRVIGVTLIMRSCAAPDELSWCCGRGAQENARAVCQTLGIRHYVIDCAREFAEAVLRPCWRAYKSGRTPNPCVACNSRIKFKLLIKLAEKLNATKIATGHYAIIEPGVIPYLKRGSYKAKDQSYFLFTLTAKQLNFSLFPLGQFSKTEVRKLAARMGFSNANRPESQDACIISAQGGFAEALRLHFDEPAQGGHFINSQGRLLGCHRGIHNFTIGQRKGLQLALGERHYVTRIDAKNQTVSLSPNPEELLAIGLIAGETSWSGGGIRTFPLHCRAQIRYRSGATEVIVYQEDHRQLRIIFCTPQKAVTPGQAVVLYQDDLVIGGGWIERGLYPYAK